MVSGQDRQPKLAGSRALDLASVAQVDRDRLYADCWRHGLDWAPLADPAVIAAPRMTATRVVSGAIAC
jgi:hypothetical protein